MTRKALDLTNQKFGELLALYPEIHDKKRGWVCSCSCGDTKWYTTFQLTGGLAKTCSGYTHKIPYSVGDKIGKLTIISFYRDEINNRWMAKCNCGCNGVKHASIRNLQRGATTHCGCSISNENRGLPEGIGARNALISSYKSSARKKFLDFTLTVEECEQLFQGDCYFCGTPPSTIFTKRNTKGSYIYNGIDRIDSSNGYTIDNVNSCCPDCNYLKSNRHNDDFLNKIKKIVEHTSKL